MPGPEIICLLKQSSLNNRPLLLNASYKKIVPNPMHSILVLGTGQITIVCGFIIKVRKRKEKKRKINKVALCLLSKTYKSKHMQEKISYLVETRFKESSSAMYTYSCMN